MSITNERSQMRNRAAANGDRASKAAQNPEIKGLRALVSVTYESVSDENGQMDDDLFDFLLKDEALAH